MSDSDKSSGTPRFPHGRPPSGGDGKQLMDPRRQRIVWAVLLALALFWGWSLLQRAEAPTEIPYSAFREELAAGNVDSVTFAGDEIRGTLGEQSFLDAAETGAGAGAPPAGAGGQAGDERGTAYREFVTYVPAVGDENLMAALEEQGVVVRVEPQSDMPWTTILINLLPIFILIWIGVLIFRRMQSRGQGLFSMGKSRARAYERGKQDTLFEDVAGEADVPFFTVTGSDFMEMLVGVGASRVRDMFEEAKKAQPAIIFIDELDSIGRRRGAGIGGGHDEREQTLNQLLSEMDGFEPTESVVVMAATNRPDILDPALLRPGRFDRRITIDLPTRADREEILRIHARDKELGGDVELEELAAATPGFSGADLENLLNEAALLAARKDKEAIEARDIDEARDKVLMGLERENLGIGEEERRLLAYHEAGHATLAAVLPHADPLHKVTIIPRGRAMGVTQQLPRDEKYVYLREYLEDRLTVLLGGRAAEELVFDSLSSGAANDLQEAKKLVRRMVLEWGMSERFGPLALGDDGENVFLGRELARRRDYSDATAREVDEEIRKILERCFERASSTLEEHREGFERLAEELLEHEEIDGGRVPGILGVEV